MADQPSLLKIVGDVLGARKSERENAVALHDFVRDSVPFGFNKFFDAAAPEDTLACGRGHGVAKSRLMAALFNTAGFESYLHFVVIPRDILMEVFPNKQEWLLPNEISHCFVEVRVAGWWCRIDSFVVDQPLHMAGKARLRRQGRQMGYGVRLGGTNTWNGQGDAFSQFNEDMMIEDHGRVEDLQAYFKGSDYRNKIFGIPLNAIYRFRGQRGVDSINDALDRFRRLGWVERAA